MKHIRTLSPSGVVIATLLFVLATLSVSSCRSGKKAATATAPSATDSLAEQAASLARLFAEVPVDTVRLCEPTLTSMDAIPFGEDATGGFGNAPGGFTFYEPGADIQGDPVAKAVKNSYNSLLVRDMIADESDWVVRALMDAGAESADEGKELTRADTLKIVRESRFVISESKLRKAIPDEGARKRAAGAIKAFNAFDGRNGEEGPSFGSAPGWKEYVAALKPLSSEETQKAFKEDFWEWYDKSRIVPEIETLMRMRKTKNDSTLSAAQAGTLERMVVGERDIDRRTILAIELLHHAEDDVKERAFFHLGEILESGQYTKYLVEAFILWRATAQFDYFGASSMSAIPNDYFNKVRAKCVDTMLRHFLATKDPKVLCLIDNLIGCGVVRRFGGYYGNEAPMYLLIYRTHRFLPPQVLGSDSLA